MSQVKTIISGFILVALGILLGFFAPKLSTQISSIFQDSVNLSSPFVESSQVPELPLLKYRLSKLKSYPFATRTIKITQVLETNEDYSTYLFKYQTVGGQISGVLTAPSQQKLTELNLSPADLKIIVMLRGWAPVESYYSGLGTKNAATYYAQQGYITIAPDFLGYAQSDPEPEDTWEGRFIKPIQVVELIESLKQPQSLELESTTIKDSYLSELSWNSDQIGLWGHSNGGQIALTVLEIINQPPPTTLWAPVTAPFPYSILFFTDELEDEGRDARAWIAQFEKDYDTRDFSLTQHLDQLQGTIILHHGSRDEAALEVWSQEFIDKVEAENEKRFESKSLLANDASNSAKLDDLPLEPVDLTYYRYPGADHNLRPNWQTVVERDLEFFNKMLK